MPQRAACFAGGARALALAAAVCACATMAMAAGPPPQRDASRGELLYWTHCIACHDTRMHWRDMKLVTDWPSLVVQVNRWQRLSGQAWSDEDVTEVARYLNALHYHFPRAVP